MKKTIYLLAFLACSSVYSQSLSVFDVDTTSFPIMKAKFFAFDKDGKQIKPNINDFSITENGQPRTIINVTCPYPKPPVPLSSVLVFDVSGSMTGAPLDMEKAVANTWINMLNLGFSDCAITSFSDNNYINQDFTTNKNKLVNGINSLGIIGGTDYNVAMIDPAAGGILMAKTGKHKRIIIFLTDGQPNFEPRTQEIIDEANKNDITIYCLSINMPAHHTMKEFSNKTGGIYFENIRSKEEAEDAMKNIFTIAQNEEFCEIDWQSGISCQSALTNVEYKLNTFSLIANSCYQSPNNAIAKLEFKPASLNLKNSKLGIKRDTTITVTAMNADFNITNISVSNAAFSIMPTSFSLKNGESKNITVSFLPPDSGYIYCKFNVENDLCPAKFYATGGFPGKKAAIRTLKLLQPNGGEVFLAGNDTIITWEGVPPDEPVTIEYRTNDNQPWIKLTDTAKGLSYKFHIPIIASDKYLARVTAKVEKIENVCIDGEVLICNQIWMCKNLNVDTYCNGDSIPEVTDPTKWASLTTGAWCYYNNDPANGEIYGKLYNWYAVNDPRGLAPEGWHIPTDAEWSDLENCVGYDGGKIKSVGTIEDGDGLWYKPNRGATNSSNFSANPGGLRFNDNGKFDQMGHCGHWWTASEFDANYSFTRILYYLYIKIDRPYNPKRFGFSVRCVRDK